MKIKIKKVREISFKENTIFFYTNKDAKKIYLRKDELDYISKEVKKGTEIIKLYDYKQYKFIINPKEENNQNQKIENLRLIGDKIQSELKEESSVLISLLKEEKKKGLAIAEGLALANYTFTQHKTFE